MPWARYLLRVFFLTIPWWYGTIGVYGQSNTTCASNLLDWYTDVVGETPCTTYQRLRQICNSDYQVQKFRPNTPGDNCNDQVSGCCCNSVSWALSMMCMNCQYDVDTETGIDAGKGAFQMYLETCNQPPAHNKTLPTDVQSAVCNREIKIDRSLYNLFWGDGSWFYVYTKQTMTKGFAATNNNTFTECASTTRNDTSNATTTITSSSAATSTTAATGLTDVNPQTKSDVGPIAGGVVGGVVVIVLAALGFFFWRRYRRRGGPTPLDLTKEYTDADNPPVSVVTPFSEAAGISPRTPPLGSSLSPGIPSQSERHEDGGPVPALQRSASGRLPPAYRRSWDLHDVPAPNGSVSGGSDVSGEGLVARSGASEQGMLRPQRLGDVKVPYGQF